MVQWRQMQSFGLSSEGLLDVSTAVLTETAERYPWEPRFSGSQPRFGSVRPEVRARGHLTGLQGLSGVYRMRNR